MKKFFASLLALVGMVAGLTLTSCGGGGGSSNLSGITIMANGASSAYQIRIGEKVDGSSTSDESGGAYYCTISDVAVTEATELVMTIDPKEPVRFGEDDKTIVWLKATVSVQSADANENAAFYNLITGIVSTNKAITKLTFPKGALTMTVTPTQITWSGEISYSAIADNSTLQEDITVNLASPIIATSKGSY